MKDRASPQAELRNWGKANVVDIGQELAKDNWNKLLVSKGTFEKWDGFRCYSKSSKYACSRSARQLRV